MHLGFALRLELDLTNVLRVGFWPGTGRAWHELHLL